MKSYKKLLGILRHVPKPYVSLIWPLVCKCNRLAPCVKCAPASPGRRHHQSLLWDARIWKYYVVLCVSDLLRGLPARVVLLCSLKTSVEAWWILWIFKLALYIDIKWYWFLPRLILYAVFTCMYCSSCFMDPNCLLAYKGDKGWLIPQWFSILVGKWLY